MSRLGLEASRRVSTAALMFCASLGQAHKDSGGKNQWLSGVFLHWGVAFFFCSVPLLGLLSLNWNKRTVLSLPRIKAMVSTWLFKRGKMERMSGCGPLDCSVYSTLWGKELVFWWSEIKTCVFNNAQDREHFKAYGFNLFWTFLLLC